MSIFWLTEFNQLSFSFSKVFLKRHHPISWNIGLSHHSHAESCLLSKCQKVAIQWEAIQTIHVNNITATGTWSRTCLEVLLKWLKALSVEVFLSTEKNFLVLPARSTNYVVLRERTFKCFFRIHLHLYTNRSTEDYWRLSVQVTLHTH